MVRGDGYAENFFHVYINMHVSSVGLIHIVCASVSPHLCLYLWRSEVDLMCLHHSPLYLLRQGPSLNADLADSGCQNLPSASLPENLPSLTSEFWNSKQLPQLLSFLCGFCRSSRCPYTWAANI